MTMKQGERQIAPTLDGIRRDHVSRYEFAAKLLPSGSRVIDFACGVGYGSRIMAEAGHAVQAYDVDLDALAYGRQYYAHPSVSFVARDANDPESLPEVDCAVCFETIEHVEDPRPLLRALREASPSLIASVPNETVMPWQREDGATTLYHFRHYTKLQFEELLRECGWCVTQWHGQQGPESEVEPGMPGRTLIAVAARDAIPEQVPGRRRIAIVGLGPSAEQYVDQVKRAGGRQALYDEVWAINAMGNVLDCDLIFHMDDVRIQEIRSKAAPTSNIAAMLQWLKTSKVPVVTSRNHPEYPALVEFPLEAVLNDLGHEYFNNTAAYAVAFAIHTDTGATEISCFGMDFTYPNAHDAEKGRGCVEYWLGYAQARGIKVNLPKKTTLMDARYSRKERLYGYDTLDVKFNLQGDGVLKLDFVPLEKLPTAEEIEANYDHTKHPNAIVQDQKEGMA